MKNSKTITVKLTLKELQNSYWSTWMQHQAISKKITNEPDPRERRALRVEKKQLLDLTEKYAQLMQKFGLTDFFSLLGQLAAQNAIADKHGNQR